MNSNELRIQYKYRQLILKEKLNLSKKNAAKLIGPDCAFHLYSQHKFPESKNKTEK